MACTCFFSIFGGFFDLPLVMEAVQALDEGSNVAVTIELGLFMAHDEAAQEEWLACMIIFWGLLLFILPVGISADCVVCLLRNKGPDADSTKFCVCVWRFFTCNCCAWRPTQDACPCAKNKDPTLKDTIDFWNAVYEDFGGAVFVLSAGALMAGGGSHIMTLAALSSVVTAGARFASSLGYLQCGRAGDAASKAIDVVGEPTAVTIGH